MDGFNPIVMGVTLVLAVGAVGAMAVLSRRSRAVFVYAQLVLMAGVYVGFALAALDGVDFVQRANISAVMIEAVIALGFLFAGLAVIGADRAWLLGAFILAHGAVDLAHLLLGVSHTPDWYAYACIIYDAIVGVAAIWLLSPQSTDV